MRIIGIKMAVSLLSRQASLLAYLASDGAVFGAAPASKSSAKLEGVDDELLRIEAYFSYEKRMGKIQKLLPRTFELLGPRLGRVLREFNKAYPPASSSAFEAAQQLRRFLFSGRLRKRQVPQHLGDVMAYELAAAEFRRDERRVLARAQSDAPRGAVRRHPDVILLRCTYDVQPVFASKAKRSAPVARDTPLAFAMPPDSDRTIVLELLPSVFELLELLDDFVDPTTLGNPSSVSGLMRELASVGLVEFRA